MSDMNRREFGRSGIAGLAGLAEAGTDGGTDSLVRISGAPTQAGRRIRHSSSPLNSRRTDSSAGHASAPVSR